MRSKLIVACMALVAFAAFVLPATASATTLTNAKGETVAPGTLLTSSNTGSTIFKGSFGSVECSTAHLTGPLFKNDPTVEGTINSASFTGTGTGGDCTSTLGAVKVTTSGAFNGTPWCVRALGDELQIRGNSCDKAARSITYVLDFTNVFGSPISCAYERTTATGPVKGTHTTNPLDAAGTVATGANSEFKIETGQSGFCPASGSLEMTFDLEIDGGGTLTIDA